VAGRVDPTVLEAVCGRTHVRPAGPQDHVAGTPARWVAAPRDTAEVSALLVAASEAGLSVAASGGGTKLDWGRAPDTVDVLLDTSRLSGVAAAGSDRNQPARDHMTLGAGTTLRAAQATLSRTGRRLALDIGVPTATIGGVLGTDEAGPLSARYGTARDLVTDLEYVTADGTIRADRLESGQASRLLLGSYGTLGVITKATLRVHPTPTTRRWVSRPVRTPLEVHKLTDCLLDPDAGPAAVEVDLPCGCDPSGGGRVRPGALVALVEGERAEVARRVRGLTRLFGPTTIELDEPPSWWGRYPFAPDELALRLAAPPADLHAAIYALRDAAGEIVPVRGSVSAGVVYAAMHVGVHPDRVGAVMSALRTTQLARGGSCTLLRATDEVRAVVDTIIDEDPDEPLLRQAKGWLDPKGRLAPGRVPCLPV